MCMRSQSHDQNATLDIIRLCTALFCLWLQTEMSLCKLPDTTSPSSGIIRHRWSITAVAHFIPDRQNPAHHILWRTVNFAESSLWCSAGVCPRPSAVCPILCRRHQDRLQPWSLHPRLRRWHADLCQLFSARSADCHKSPAGLRSRYWSANDVESAEETEFIWLDTRQQLAKVSSSPLLING